MEIEIVVAGESSRWIFNQPRIRIGNDPACDVSLPAARYPAVVAEHLVLEAAADAVKLARMKRSSGETYLNGSPVSGGATVRSGDVLRLGAGGPELRIRLIGLQEAAPASGYEPTRVLQVPNSPPHEPTRISHDATRIMPGPAAGARYPQRPEAAQSGPGSPNGAQPRFVADAASRRPDPPAYNGGTTVEDSPFRPQPRAQAHVPTPPPPAAERGDGGETARLLEAKLKGLRIILFANLAILAILLFWDFQLGRQLTQTQQDLRDLRVQAQSAMGQLTPSLDARLSVFEKRMDGMDSKLKAAGDKMAAGIDAKMQAGEDHMVTRMNTEIPAMLDKYVAKKMTEVKH